MAAPAFSCSRFAVLLDLISDGPVNESVDTLAPLLCVGLNNVLLSFWHGYIDPVVLFLDILVYGPLLCL